MFSKNSFIERSLLGALSFLKDSVYADEVAVRPGLLQSLDPRMKLALVLTVIVGMLFMKDLVLVLFIYALCLLLASLSKISLKSFIVRTWIFIPIFSLFIALPAIFGSFTPGEALVSWNIFGHYISITRQGLGGAALFVIRVTTCVSFAALLSLTTRHSEILKALRSFGIPKIYVMVFGMCYRYIFLFIEVVENTYMAIKSRVGSRLHHRKGQQVVAWNIGSLCMRSYNLSSDIYNAMISRGYTGEAK